MVIATFGTGVGAYIVAESIDCGGKGTVIEALKAHFQKQNLEVVDLRELWQIKCNEDVDNNNVLCKIYGDNEANPFYSDLKKRYESEGKKIGTIVCCEPTWGNIGLKIRNKLIHEIKGLQYSSRDVANAYAEDRYELISKLIRPAILDGVNVLSERNFCSSVVYQSSMHPPLAISDILKIPGNAFAVKYAPHLYIICDIKAETAIDRISTREKQDKCMFEKLDFLKLIEQKYTAEKTAELLESQGSMVVYLNTDKPKTVLESQETSIEIIKEFFLGRVKSRQRFGYSSFSSSDSS